MMARNNSPVHSPGEDSAAHYPRAIHRSDGDSPVSPVSLIGRANFPGELRMTHATNKETRV
jgi:hypothetical protein